MVETTGEQIASSYLLSNSIDKIENRLDSIACQIDNSNATLHAVLDSVPNMSASINSFVEHSINDTFLRMPVSVAQFVLPAVITVVLFFLGYYMNNKKENNRRESEEARKQERKLASLKADCVAIKEYVRALNDPINKLCSNIHAFTTLLKESHDIQLEAFSLSNISVECLKQFDLHTLSRMYITNRSGDNNAKAIHVYHVISSIEFLSKIEGILIDHYKEYREHSLDNMKQWNDEYEKLVAYMRDIEFRNRKKDMFDEFNKLLFDANKNGNKYIESQILTDEVYKPFCKWISAHYDQNDYDARIIDDMLYRSIFIYDEKKKTCFDGYADVFNDVATHIKSAYENLLKCLNALDSNEFVDISSIE